MKTFVQRVRLDTGRNLPLLTPNVTLSNALQLLTEYWIYFDQLLGPNATSDIEHLKNELNKTDSGLKNLEEL